MTIGKKWLMACGFFSLLLTTGCTSYKKSLYLQNEQVLNQLTQGQLYDFPHHAEG